MLVQMLNFCRAIGEVVFKEVSWNDVRPENILVTKEDPPQPVFLDFGMAGPIEEPTGDRRKTEEEYRSNRALGAMGSIFGQLEKACRATSDVASFEIWCDQMLKVSQEDWACTHRELKP